MRNIPIISLAPILVLAACTASDSDEDNVAGESAREVAAAMAKGGISSLKPGQWITKLTVSKIDIPGVAASRKADVIARVEKAGTHESCLSAEDAKAPPAGFFVKNAKECTYSGFAVDNGNASIALSCDMGSVGAIDMEMDGPISADVFEFDADVALRLPMIGKVPIKATVTGRYDEECRNTK